MKILNYRKIKLGKGITKIPIIFLLCYCVIDKDLKQLKSSKELEKIY